IVLTIVLAMAGLTACGSTESETTDTAAATTTTAATTTSEPETTTTAAATTQEPETTTTEATTTEATTTTEEVTTTEVDSSNIEPEDGEYLPFEECIKQILEEKYGKELDYITESASGSFLAWTTDGDYNSIFINKDIYDSGEKVNKELFDTFENGVIVYKVNI
ncbi:MAG: hypothetical protein IJ806_08975, partial [Ruminococcus sp.]|nr:hypothetical protein [Ruminococcus sp.]